MRVSWTVSERPRSCARSCSGATTIRLLSSLTALVPADQNPFPAGLRPERAEGERRRQGQAKAADDLARRLHLELVRATGRSPIQPTSTRHPEYVSILDAALYDLRGT